MSGSSVLEPPQIPIGKFLGLAPFPAAARGKGAVGANARQDQFLLVQRQVEQAKHDAVDQQVQFGGAGARCLAAIRQMLPPSGPHSL